MRHRHRPLSDNPKHHTRSTTKGHLLRSSNTYLPNSSINNNLRHHRDIHHNNTRNSSNTRNNNCLNNCHQLPNPQLISSTTRSRSLYPHNQAIKLRFPSRLYLRTPKKMLCSAHSARPSSRRYAKPLPRTHLRLLLSAPSKPHFRPHIPDSKPSSVNYSNSTQHSHPTNRSSRAQ
jgi:hypothetical protein